MSEGSRAAPVVTDASPLAAAAATPALRGAMPADDEPVWYGEARARGLLATRFVADEQGRALDSAVWSMTRIIGGVRRVLSPRLTYEVELEALSGFVGGQSTELGMNATDRPFPTSRTGMASLARVLPRKLNVQWTTSVGRVVAGAQTFTWGSGMLANDGTGDPDFGDAWTGNIVARLAFATQPLAKTAAPAPLRTIAMFAAGDFVLRDDNASVYDGDRAFSGSFGILADEPSHGAGVLASVRRQRDRVDPGLPAGERARTTAYVLDVFARGSVALTRNDRLVLEVEGALVRGETTRLLSEATFGRAADLRQLGGLARVGWRHADTASVHVETGLASGDNDPRDATARTFTMHSDHQVGLVLFDQVLPLVTARAVDRASDPALVGVPMAGMRFAINPGAVQNAIYGTAVVRARPYRSLDARLGYLYAVPAADILDVYQTAMQGGFTTGYGGRVHDRSPYGHELDARATYDIAVPRDLELRVGADAGVLFPGAAFAGVDRIRPTGGDARALWLARVIATLFW